MNSEEKSVKIEGLKNRINNLNKELENTNEIISELSRYIRSTIIYKENCIYEMNKLSKDTFNLYSDLSELNNELTSIKCFIVDNEKLLNEKESENPRSLRDSLNEQEEKRANIITSISLKKNRQDALAKAIKDLQKKIATNEKEVNLYNKRITVASNILEQKSDSLSSLEFEKSRLEKLIKSTEEKLSKIK